MKLKNKPLKKLHYCTSNSLSKAIRYMINCMKNKVSFRKFKLILSQKIFDIVSIFKIFYLMDMLKRKASKYLFWKKWQNFLPFSHKYLYRVQIFWDTRQSSSIWWDSLPAKRNRWYYGWVFECTQCFQCPQNNFGLTNYENLVKIDSVRWLDRSWGYTNIAYVLAWV